MFDNNTLRLPNKGLVNIPASPAIYAMLDLPLGMSRTIIVKLGVQNYN